MKRISFIVLAGFLATACQSAVLSTPAAEQPSLRPFPEPTGLYAQPLSSSYGQWFSLSPDATAMAISSAGSAEIRALGSSQPEVQQNRLAHAVAATFSGLGRVDSVAWADDSSRLWLLTSSMNATSIRPATLTRSGRLVRQPELRHENGALDGLVYAGGQGLAVAKFGTRPTLRGRAVSSSKATLAIVDTTTGQVRSSLVLADVLWSSAEARRSPPPIGLGKASAAVLADGRVRAVVQVTTRYPSGQARHAWILWTEDEAPLVMADPSNGALEGSLLLAPDGSSLISTIPLRAYSDCPPDVNCPDAVIHPGIGRFAALYDAKSGNRLWELRGTAQTSNLYPRPAISPDGRFAAVGLPPTAWEDAQVALVSMQTGHILSTLSVDLASYDVGFAQEGRAFWLHANGRIQIYDMAVFTED